jgi:hypothetical protein
VRRGQHLTRPNQCAGAVSTMTKAVDDIHPANRYPRPSVRTYGYSMINRGKYATRVGCRRRLLSFALEREGARQLLLLRQSIKCAYLCSKAFGVAQLKMQGKSWPSGLRWRPGQFKQSISPSQYRCG